MKLINKLILLFVLMLFIWYDFGLEPKYRVYSVFIFLFLFWLWFLRRKEIKRTPIKPSVRMKVLKRDNYVCQKCGRTPPEVKLEVDHKVPWSWNKTEHMSENPDDYITLCRDCNIGKGNKFSD